MQNLNLILVLSLISFSFQSDSCLKTFKICSSDSSAVKAPYKSIDKYIVYDENGDYCTQCKTGYATSDDGENCISFQNCIDLGNGNEECGTCYDGYYINSQGQCEKINIDYCVTKDDSGCTVCIYDIIQPNDDGQCVLPTTLIEGWTSYDSDGNCNECNDSYELKDNSCEFKECEEGIPLFLIAEFAKLVIILNTQMEIVLNLVKEKSILTLILI